MSEIERKWNLIWYYFRKTKGVASPPSWSSCLFKENLVQKEQELKLGNILNAWYESGSHQSIYENSNGILFINLVYNILKTNKLIE